MELPFELGEQKDHNETGTETVPSARQPAFFTAPGAQRLLLQALTRTDSLSLPIPYGWNLYFLPL